MSLFSSRDDRVDTLLLNVANLTEQVAALSRRFDLLGGLNTLAGDEKARLAALEAAVATLRTQVR